jgi:hypothetical protein
MLELKHYTGIRTNAGIKDNKTNAGITNNSGMLEFRNLGIGKSRE